MSDNLQRRHWETAWCEEDIHSLYNTIRKKKFDKDYIVDIFKENNIKTICDAGCGFGFYSVNLAKRGFLVSAFDISSKAIEITKNIMKENNINYDEIKQSSITNINFKDNYFQGTFVNSIIDHLTIENALLAIKEINRITKKHGLIYLSFDKVNEEDYALPHIILEDGSYLYTEGKRSGMILHNYKENDIKKLLLSEEIIYFNSTDENIDVVYKNNK